MSDRDLGPRAPAVFASFLDGSDAALHPEDRAEAARFWTWLGELDRPEPAPVRQRPEWPRRMAAAFAAVAVFSGIWWVSRPAPQSTSEAVQSVATGHAERRRIELDDGSVVTLAADSRVEVVYSPAERRLRLTGGEALFKVAHNAERPFIVQTSHGEVRAVGTAFDVSVGRREAEVTVIEGVIRISLAGQRGAAVAEPIEKLARKGERVAFGVGDDRGSNTSFIRQAPDTDADSATAWTRGKLIFKGEPLGAVIAKINLYAKERVVLTDPSAASLPVYGVVDQGDTEAIRDLIANPNAVAVNPRD